jgi:hypothetical protein
VLDVRWAEGDYTRFAALAFEFLERKNYAKATMLWR